MEVIEATFAGPGLRRLRAFLSDLEARLEGQRAQNRMAARIRRRAKKEGVVAKKARKGDLWYFADERNFLQSPEQGLSGEEALEWLTQEG